MAAALQHAGLTEAEITNLYVKADRDDGRTVYDVEFLAGGKEYDYEIDAATGCGALVRHRTGAWRGLRQRELRQRGLRQYGLWQRERRQHGGHRADAAKNAAFRHAGVSASDATRVKVERDRDNGVLLYEVEFRVGNYEYEYEISAATGEVLGHSGKWKTTDPGAGRGAGAVRQSDGPAGFLGGAFRRAGRRGPPDLRNLPSFAKSLAHFSACGTIRQILAGSAGLPDYRARNARLRQ